MTTLWIRCGKADEYQDMGPESKGTGTLKNAGLYLANCGAVPPLTPIASYGVIDEGEFRGRNYINIYWGDADVKPIRDLAVGELAEIIRVLAYYGGYEPPF